MWIPLRYQTISITVIEMRILEKELSESIVFLQRFFFSGKEWNVDTILLFYLFCIINN